MKSDVERGLDLMRVLCKTTETMDMIVHEGAPRSKSRPKVVGGNVYTPSKPFQDELATRIMAARVAKRTGNVAIGVIFFRPNYQRIDTDNLLKLVLDACTQAQVWQDDSQVTAVLGITELDPDRPRTVIMLGDHVSTLDRGLNRTNCVCPQCEKPFYGFQSTRRKFCSRECRAASTKRSQTVRLGQGRGTKGRPPATCKSCGRELSKRTYERCRDCWRVNL